MGDADKKEPRYWAPTLFIDDVGITDREASREAFGSGINSSRRLFHPLASISLVVCGKLCTRCAPGVRTLKKKRREKVRWVTRRAVPPFPSLPFQSILLSHHLLLYPRRNSFVREPFRRVHWRMDRYANQRFLCSFDKFTPSPISLGVVM